MPGKALYQVWRTNFEIDTKYEPIKAIGKGAYGVVCSAKHAESGGWVGGGAQLLFRVRLLFPAHMPRLLPIHLGRRCPCAPAALRRREGGDQEDHQCV